VFRHICITHYTHTHTFHTKTHTHHISHAHIAHASINVTRCVYVQAGDDRTLRRCHRDYLVNTIIILLLSIEKLVFVFVCVCVFTFVQILVILERIPKFRVCVCMCVCVYVCVCVCVYVCVSEIRECHRVLFVVAHMSCVTITNVLSFLSYIIIWLMCMCVCTGAWDPPLYKTLPCPPPNLKSNTQFLCINTYV